ncbi:MAG TPA: prepilin-type N-terminal cleavage/methylation domain-containing protein [Candidatus Dormibacteraeota bacterium]|nr:prepilin-type N-terminal cleavage/methylation domain-containing protein [Candidatus Dormibacteraeota bacterium]
MKKASRNESGMSLVELMIAMVVLLVGLVGSTALVAVSVGNNNRSRQQGNSNTVSQLITEEISSVKASTSPNLTVTDCAGNAFIISTTAPGGSPLTGNGDIDFTQPPVPNYQMLYTDCGTNGRQATYDVRWNIQQPTPYTKLLTVSAQRQNVGRDLRYFSLPVIIRTVIGQGT